MKQKNYRQFLVRHQLQAIVGAMLLFFTMWGISLHVNADIGPITSEGSHTLFIEGKKHDLNKDASGNGWTFQAAPRILTLNNYNGSKIYIYQEEEADIGLSVVLKGNNVINLIDPEYDYNPIFICTDKTVTISGSGTLTVNSNAETEGLVYGAKKYYLINCGKITLNYTGRTASEFFPFEFWDEQNVYMYNTDIEVNNFGVEEETVDVDHFFGKGYNSNITFSSPQASWFVSKDLGISKVWPSNITAYVKSEAFKKDVSYQGFSDQDYFKVSYGTNSSFCVPSTGSVEVYSDGTKKYVRKCIDCGKTLETCIPKIYYLELDYQNYYKIFNNLVVGQTVELKPTLYPPYASDTRLIWNVNDTNKATIFSDGTFIAKEKGEVSVTIRPLSNIELSNTLYGWISNPANKPIIIANNLTINGLSNRIATGKKVQLSVTTSPENAANVFWESSDTRIATVTQTGLVTMKPKTGGKTVTITATAVDGSGTKAVYTIKSMKGVVKKVNISGAKQVKAGKSLKLKGKVSATSGANKTLKWTSSNTEYATVSASGKVATKAAGKGKTVKITAAATDGSGKKKTVKIKIK